MHKFSKSHISKQTFLSDRGWLYRFIGDKTYLFTQLMLFFPFHLSIYGIITEEGTCGTMVTVSNTNLHERSS